MYFRRKKHKCLATRIKHPVASSIRHNICWRIDFMLDKLLNGRTFKVLNIIDNFNRKALTLKLYTGIIFFRLVRILESLKKDGLLH